MNLLESQVADLSYLTDLTPLPLQSVAQLGNMEMNSNEQSRSSTAEANTNQNGKRKADDNNGGTSAPQPRAKRNRYINQAWYDSAVLSAYATTDKLMQ